MIMYCEIHKAKDGDREGPQGAQGVPGPQGPHGPHGPPVLLNQAGIYTPPKKYFTCENRSKRCTPLGGPKKKLQWPYDGGIL